jgi:hypothetical protein
MPRRCYHVPFSAVRNVRLVNVPCALGGIGAVAAIAIGAACDGPTRISTGSDASTVGGDGRNPSPVQADGNVSDSSGANRNGGTSEEASLGCQANSTDAGCGDCEGGSCQAGACVALPAGVLATGQHGPIAIAVDSSNVYWLDVGAATSPGPGAIPSYYQGGQVMECAIGGCRNSPVVLASGWSQAAMYPAPSALTVDTTNVYWSGGGSGVLSCAIAGCGCEPTVRALVSAAGVAVASGGIYMTEYGTGTIWFCPPAGCPSGPSTFANSPGGPLGIAHDDSNVYWIDSNGVLQGCLLSGCGPGGPASLITPTAAGSQALTVDDVHLYWTNGNADAVGSVEQCDKSNCASTVTTLASGRSGPKGIAVDTRNVYWVEGGSVYKCAIGGCGNSPVAVAAASGPAIALDSTHLYVSQSASGSQDGGNDPLDQYIVALPK